MKLKELLEITRFAKNEKNFTLIDYDIYDYLEGKYDEIICTLSSDIEFKYFLKDFILEAEVIEMGAKSETEIVFRLAEDWCEQKEDQITDVKIPSRIIEISVTKNTSGLVDVTLNDIEESEMLDFIQHFCEYTGAEAIFDKGGKWSIPLDDDNEGGDDNGKQ